MELDIKTFNDDLFELSGFADRLEKFIKVEGEFVQGSLVLMLNSKYGSGKSTFLNMWKSKLEKDKNNSEKPLVISLNAWESDYYGDPLFAIISGIVESLPKEDNSKVRLIQAAKKVGWMSVSLAGQFVKNGTGFDLEKAGKTAEEKTTNSLPSDAFSLFVKRKEAMLGLQEAIKKYVEICETQVLFLVDELDRCRPDYAISYLETIKHIFDVPGAVFILAADREQLENSAKTAFGPGLDFNEYYRKFVHREVKLPPISEVGYSELAKEYVEFYLKQGGLRNSFMQLGRYQIDSSVKLIRSMKLTPRQIQEIFRILGHLLEASEQRSGRLDENLATGSVAMAIFKVGMPNVFHLLGTQQYDPKEAHQFLSGLKPAINVNWWFMFFLSEGGLKVNSQESAVEMLKDIGILKEDSSPEQAESYLIQHDVYFDEWRDEVSKHFTMIHQKINEILQWN